MTSMTSRDVIRILNGGQMAAGYAMAQLSRAKRPGSGATVAQIRWLEQMAQSRRSRPQVRVPAHPQDSATRARYRRNPDEELSAVELAWLDRLPRDPAQVRFEDAERLAALAGSISSMNAPQSARLVDAVWEPVKALHDRRVAAARLERAQQPVTSVSNEATQALADSLAQELEGVSEAGLVLHAREMLGDLQDRWSQTRESELTQARRAVEELDRAKAGHDALTREVAS